MERYYDTMRYMIALTDTGIEALEYLAVKLKNNSEEIPLYLYADFLEAYSQLCRSFEILERKLPGSRIKELENIVGNELIAFWSTCQAGSMVSMTESLGKHLIPVVKAYRSELADCVNPYILS